MNIDWGNPTTYIAILAVGGAIYGIGRFIFEIGYWYRGVNEFQSGANDAISNTNDAISNIETGIGDIKNLILNAFFRSSKTLEAKSPLSLSEKGRQISVQLDVPTWAEDTARNLAPELSSLVPYEIQEFCFKYVGDFRFERSAELYQKIQSVAYDSATTIQEIKDVYAVVLRDEILKITGEEES